MDVPAPAPRVLVVEHQASCPPARVGAWLEDAGVVIDVRRPYLGDDLTKGDHAGLLVLGGSMGANDDGRAPWLPAVRDLVRGAAGTGLPVLGICLGHQLAAVALGGRVGRNPTGQTVGIREVTRSPVGLADDAVAGALPETSVVPQWNDDAVLEAPAGTVAVATNDRGDLLMARYTPSVWGIQGHPEATAEVVGDWAEKDLAEGGLTGCSAEELPGVLARVREHEDAVESAWRPVVTAWARLVR